MVTKLAWRNVWRNKTRSGVLLLAITFGLWGGISAMGIMSGMNNQRIKDFLETQVSHIQMHHPDYVQDQDVTKTLEQPVQHLQQIEKNAQVEGVTSRAVMNGMISSPTNSTGVRINGISPSREKHVTTIHDRIRQGSYFQEDKTNPVLIGQKLADQMGVGMGSKVVLNFQDLSGEITSGAFTVIGLYETSNAQFDKNNAFIPKQKAQELLGEEDIVHEMAIYLKIREKTSAVAEKLSNSLPDSYKVQTWRDIQPSLAYINDFNTQLLYFIMVIILLGLAFGIMNTMLMAIIERTRELGMLMAVGMSKNQVFRMVITETIFLSIQGGIIGILIGFGTIEYFGNQGISVAAFSEGLSSFGYGDKIFPLLEFYNYPIIAGLVILTALLSAIYPAWKALKLNPAEAIREI